MRRSVPKAILNCWLTFPFGGAYRHADYVRRNCLKDENHIMLIRSEDDNTVHTKEGDFLMYYCRVKGSEGGNGMIVIGPNGLDAWYMGDWEREWKPRMLEMRRYPTYREFLNHTCICRTNNINSWLI